jgi:hypothetical protein
MAGTTSALDCPHCGAENVGALFIVDGATCCGYCKPTDLKSQLARVTAERDALKERYEYENDARHRVQEILEPERDAALAEARLLRERLVRECCGGFDECPRPVEPNAQDCAGPGHYCELWQSILTSAPLAAKEAERVKCLEGIARSLCYYGSPAMFHSAECDRCEAKNACAALADLEGENG